MSENGHKKPYFVFDNIRLYPDQRLLIKNDDRIPLTPRVMDLLIVLVKHQGELVSKEALLETVWAGRFVEDGNLNRTISTLRKNLGSRSNGNDLIETVPKLGYRFIAGVTEVSANQTIGTEVFIQRKTSWQFWLIGLAGAVLIGIAAYYFLIPRAPVTIDGMTRLTNNLAEDESPEWSPDGKRIAFASNRDGAKNIYVMNADGSSVVRLTNGSVADDVPVWSPDGTKILFGSMRDGNLEIYIMNSDGSDQTRLTYNSVVDGGPAHFSPDGQKVVFSRSAANEGDAYYNFDIYTMNIDGSDVRQLTFDTEYDAGPDWSPDGSKIAFVSGREKNFDVFVMNADGSDEINLTKDRENDSPNGWTPDSKQIFYNVQPLVQGSSNQLYLMNADGSNRRQITSFSDKTYHISYSPTAKKMAFALTRDGNYEIYSMDVANLLNN
jgi:DNA-binding winged helix-turn-helix (wHTH) protein/dipeptidyl aminopeptidase/acylaminoacyl peptidase